MRSANERAMAHACEPDDAAGSSKTAAAEPASAAARSFAMTLRAFDAALTDAEIETIARAIDAGRASVPRRSVASRALNNSDDLVVRFVVEPGIEA